MLRNEAWRTSDSHSTWLRFWGADQMDNLAAHKSPVVEQLVKAAGAEVRFLPAYLPDLNPIEKMWSKIKSLLRSAEARTPAELNGAISLAFSKITEKDAAGWPASCGYSII
ncbi:transposase [Prosthecobacter fluviatilis]|uniref:Transposase n=1 Tax=Prosthecobacter fluviatilis TaxID=445931 RepID=A0ABW0KSN2_9BACT